MIGGKRRKSDAVKCMFFRLLRQMGIHGGRSFYCLRITAAPEIEKINPLVTKTFLAHAERGMKKLYAQRHFELLGEALAAGLQGAITAWEEGSWCRVVAAGLVGHLA